MLPAIERRPRRSMYASESFPPSTIATRTSCGSELIRIRFVWVIAFSPARQQRPSEDGGGERRSARNQPGEATSVRRSQAGKPVYRGPGVGSRGGDRPRRPRGHDGEPPRSQGPGSHYPQHSRGGPGRLVPLTPTGPRSSHHCVGVRGPLALAVALAALAVPAPASAGWTRIGELPQGAGDTRADVELLPGGPPIALELIGSDTQFRLREGLLNPNGALAPVAADPLTTGRAATSP